MTFDATFDARQVQPRQGGGRHPVGNKFPFKITGTEAKAVKTEPGQPPKGGLFEVEFTSPAGSIKFNYNLWNESEQARKIANEQLSALCHATGIFQLDFKNDGAALRGAQGLMDIGFQKGHEPSAEKPEGGYVEIKKIYDMAGNEPGKGPAQAQQQGQPNQPQTQQGGPQVQQGWNGGAQQPSQAAAPQTGSAPAWGGNQPQQAPQNAPQWAQNNGGAPQSPPWGQ
jgi:hypothetical protein